MTMPEGELIQFIQSFEEVDTAMFDRLSSCIIDGKSVETTYYSPDVDLEELDTPSIVLYRTSPFRDLARWKNETIRDNYKYDVEGNLVSLDKRKFPEPWNVLYTVKTLYEYQTDGVALNDYILRAFSRGDFITINDINYDVDLTSSGLWGGQYKDFGRTQDGIARRFQETFAFTVRVWYDIYTRETFPVMNEFKANIDQK
jgi:hypothetical protein